MLHILYFVHTESINPLIQGAAEKPDGFQYNGT